MKRLLWLTLLTAGCATQPGSPSTSPQAANTKTLARFVLLNGQEKVNQDTRLKRPCHLKLRIEGEATVAIATFTGNQADSPGAMPPRVLQLQQKEDVLDWELKEPQGAGRLYIAVLPNDCDKAKELANLVDDWKNKTSPRANQVVRDKIVAWEQALDSELRHEGPALEDTGGVTSHSAFNGNYEATRPLARKVAPILPPDGGGNEIKKDPPDWRPMADSVECSAEKPGVYSYPIQFDTE
ncbi:hypothetical protein JST97_37185 [bacterium]|nr:hypothetical protein [bacterium]